VRAGDADQARVWVEELEVFAAGSSLPWAEATALFGRAMIAGTGPDEDPDVLFQRALAHHAVAGRPFDRARTQLAHGELLRRTGRRADARAPLRQALETLLDLDAEPLAARAADELRASGETARKRDESTLLALTPMERKVALLVSQGLSNKDVAAQCWVSPRTVAFHLRNVFAKAGVTSRGELSRLNLG
jgi:DNA-binding CsgD family transcriptional regulator